LRSITGLDELAAAAPVSWVVLLPKLAKTLVNALIWIEPLFDPLDAAELAAFGGTVADDDEPLLRLVDVAAVPTERVPAGAVFGRESLVCWADVSESDGVIRCRVEVPVDPPARWRSCIKLVGLPPSAIEENNDRKSFGFMPIKEILLKEKKTGDFYHEEHLLNHLDHHHLSFVP